MAFSTDFKYNKMQLEKHHREALMNEYASTLEMISVMKKEIDNAEGIKEEQKREVEYFLYQQRLITIQKAISENEIDY